MTRTFTRPTTGRTYWAALAEPSSEWTTVYGSHYGARVDDVEPGGYGAALFTTRELAETYRTTLAAWRDAEGLGSDVPGVVAPVIYRGGSAYPTAPTA